MCAFVCVCVCVCVCVIGPDTAVLVSYARQSQEEGFFQLVIITRYWWREQNFTSSTWNYGMHRGGKQVGLIASLARIKQKVWKRMEEGQ